ncbi:hypothetical protein [Phenylobacterium sp.]|uniref:hypothetical protein n=1 Tax=Phenylobacterium sp. TaxID=1871053 RepID=UPI0025EFFCE7|nr:hypothetical protein [Phenylobacterium sp.]
MPTEDQPPTSTPRQRPLADLAEGQRHSLWQGYQNISNAPAAALGAALSPMKTAHSVRSGIETGAACIFSLALVHGALAVSGMLEPNLSRLAIHGFLTLTAVLAYYAILHGRTIWPSLIVLGWYLFEIFLSRRLLGYALGATTFNVIMLPWVLLAVRASWRRRQLAKSPAAGAAAAP